MNYTEYLWTPTLSGYMEQGMITHSGRITDDLLNTLLHRANRIDTIKIRTMTDLVTRKGMDYIAYHNHWADEVLTQHGWDPENGLPTENAFLAPGISAWDPASYGLTDDPLMDLERCSTVSGLIQFINSKREPEAQIPRDSDKPFMVELDDKNTVRLSFDTVCAKRQKDTRNRWLTDYNAVFTHDAYDGPAEYARVPEPKKRPRVDTAVAHIEVGDEKYLLIADNMFNLFKQTIAFLLYKRLLIGRQLVIFSDGGHDIKFAVENLFKFYPNVIVVLDWFHFKKHTSELMSMAFVGGKKNKKWRYEISRRIFHILYVGNTESAIDVLKSIDPSYIKDADWYAELISYLGRKDYAVACYAVRKMLKLRISSNPVEKANDLIVARRQKWKGISWSRLGSWGLAAVTVMYLNHEADNWSSDKTVSFEMYKEYGKVFDLKSQKKVMVA